MASVTGSFRLVLLVGITTFSPITVTEAFSLPITVTVTTGGDAFSLIPVDAGSLILTPVTPASLGALVPA